MRLQSIPAEHAILAPMCRALLYLGRPVPLDWLLLRPDNSLVRQALTPQMLHLLNIAGFGAMA